MKNRDYKEFAQGEYYHIYNRGNGKMDIFKDNQDFLSFLKRLKLVLGVMPRVPLVINQGEPLASKRSLRIKSFPEGSFDIICYCLMPNHFHFIIHQKSNISISKLVAKLCTSYSMYFNRKNKRVGTLFQDTFKAVLIDDNFYLLWLSAYIHQNPKVAGIVKDLKNYEWSSYSDYVGVRKGMLCKNDIVLDQFKSRSDYARFVDDSFQNIKERKEELENLFLD